MREVVHVECYSGHTYAQEPRAITRDGTRYPVQRMLRGWREPGGPCFAVTVGDGEEIVLCYDEVFQRWEQVHGD